MQYYGSSSISQKLVTNLGISMGNSCELRSPLLAKLAKGLASTAHSCSLSAAWGNHPVAASPCPEASRSPEEEGKNSPPLLVKHCAELPGSYRISSEKSKQSTDFGWVGFVLQILCEFSFPLLHIPPTAATSEHSFRSRATTR